MIVTLVGIAALINILAKVHNYGIPTDKPDYKNIRVRRDSPDDFQLYPYKNNVLSDVQPHDYNRHSMKEISNGHPNNKIKRNVAYNNIYNGYNDSGNYGYNNQGYNRMYYGNNSFQNGNIQNTGFNRDNNNMHQGYNGYIDYNDTAINRFYYGDQGYNRSYNLPNYGPSGYTNTLYNKTHTGYSSIGYKYPTTYSHSVNYQFYRQNITNNASIYNGNQLNTTYDGITNNFYNPFRSYNTRDYSDIGNSYNGTTYNVNNTLVTTTPKIVTAFVIGHVGCPAFFKKFGMFCVKNDDDLE